RVVIYRAVQDRVAILVATLRTTEAAYLKVSGISEVVSDKDSLLREYIQLSKEVKLDSPNFTNPTWQVYSSKQARTLSIYPFSCIQLLRQASILAFIGKISYQGDAKPVK